MPRRSRVARTWHVVRRVWITLGVAATIVFAAWSLLAYRASDAARRAAVGDARVTVTDVPGARRFAPAAGARHDVGLLFVAGALVDPAAYAPIARAAAESGYVAYVLALPRRGAFGGADDPALDARARALLRGGAADPSRWVLGGHSRGAVVSVRLAHERAPGIAALVLVGTSHPRDVSLAALALPVTKVVGTRDGLASRAEVEANRALLPARTRWVWIEGGNHSQFGWYGFQPGDRRARVAPDVQRAAMLGAILDQLRDVAP